MILWRWAWGGIEILIERYLSIKIIACNWKGYLYICGNNISFEVSRGQRSVPYFLSSSGYAALPFLEGKRVNRVDRWTLPKDPILLLTELNYVEPSLVRTPTSGADAPLYRNSMFSCK